MMMKGKKLTKKIYSKPQLEVVNVDHEISLVMESGPPDNGGFERGGSSGSDQPVFNSSSESNAFGGSAPDYSN